MQELWDLFPEEELSDTPSCDTSDTASQLCLFLSDSAVSGKDSPKSMRLMGSILRETSPYAC
jgi:hypothetical protein